MYQAVNTREPMLGTGTYGTGKPGTSGYADASPKQMDQNIQPMRMDKQENPKCNDSFFAILFIINIITISFFAFWKGLAAINAISPEFEQMNKPINNHLPKSYSMIFAILSGLSGFALLVSVFWMQLLLAYAENMIRIALWMNVGLMFGMAVATIFVNPILSLLLLVMVSFTICYIWAVQNRIAFASANLKCACTAISKHKAIFVVAISFVIVQLLWIVLWVLGALGVYQLFRETDKNCQLEEKSGQICGAPGSSVALFFVLISLYWGQQVIQNILTCTTAGTVAAWWYQENPKRPVTGSLYRSMTTSFGSICFGSLIVAILQSLRTVARIIREKAQDDNNPALACIACLAECILNCLESIMEYFNMWAYVYIGIYGYDFKSSGKAVMDLFTYRGWTAVINDDLATSALNLGAFGVALVTCGIGLLVAKFSPEYWVEPLQDSAAKYITFGLVGFVAGLSMALVLATVVITGLHTVFVCFAEDPIAFSKIHPQLHAQLVAAWQKFHQDAYVVAYGDAL